MKRFFIFFALCALFIAESNAKSISEIKYSGLVRMSPLIANEIAKIKTGDKLNAKAVNDAILAFYKQDYFDDVSAEFEHGVLTFHFKEKPSINNIEIKGFGSESETEDMKKSLGIKRGDTYDIYKEKLAKAEIINALETKGLYGSVVEVSATRIEDSMNLLFDVNKGEKIIIRKSYYQGATLDKDDLEGFSANRERHSWLGWLPWFPSGEVRLKELEYDNLRIQDVYMQRGYLDASVSPGLLNADFTNFNASLLYKVVEGERYKVSDIIIAKADDFENVFDIDELEGLLKIQKDEYFNIQTMRNDIEILKSHIMDKGYAFAVISPDLDKDTEHKQVIVKYNITIGKEVHINDITITGNTVSSDRIVRRELIIAPGDTYSITSIRKSENALRRSGFFDKVNISEIRIDESSMNLLVEVSEGRTGEVMAGIGYGSYDKFMINGSLRERNLFGTGIGVSFQINWSKYNQLYNVGLSNPRIFDSEYSASINVFHSYYESYYSRYDGLYSGDTNYVENTTGFNIGVGRNLTDELSANLTYGFSVSTFGKISHNVGYDKYYPQNGIWKSYLTPGLYFDNTDDYYFPKNGVIAQISSDFMGLGGNARYAKLYGKVGLYYHLRNLIDFDVILRYKAQIGAIFAYKKSEELMKKDQVTGVPITDRFYLGGIGTVRGYNSSQVSPFEPDDSCYGRRCLIGGNYMFSNSVEISFGLIEAINMRLAGFFDYGMVGRDKFNEIYVMSAGLAIEWISPIGPLVFVVPFAINPPDNFKDEVSKFEFTMGTRF
ncbi:outer membrane protein assembly factor BamA [Helicobacter sp. 23-1044]